jgi:hypothetical protein
MVQVFPNSRNVIPGRVKFSMDLRNATDALTALMRWRGLGLRPKIRQQRRSTFALMSFCKFARFTHPMPPSKSTYIQT